MKSKWLFLLLWMCVIVRPEAWGQEVKSANTVAEEWIQVSSSSATVLQWFEWIEKSTGIVLSYNPAQMELGEVCRIEPGGRMTVEELLHCILSGYQVKIAFVPPRKLVVHARKIESYDVSGTVSEVDSEERLYGAVVTLEDKGWKNNGIPFRMEKGFSVCMYPRNIYSENFLHGLHSAGAVGPGDERLFYPYPYETIVV